MTPSQGARRECGLRNPPQTEHPQRRREGNLRHRTGRADSRAGPPPTRALTWNQESKPAPRPAADPAPRPRPKPLRGRGRPAHRSKELLSHGPEEAVDGWQQLQRGSTRWLPTPRAACGPPWKTRPRKGRLAGDGMGGGRERALAENRLEHEMA